MRVNIILGPSLPIPPIKGGGIEIFAYGLAKELAKKYKVKIYSRRYRGLSNYEKDGNIEYVRVWGFDRVKSKFITSER